MCRFGDHHIDRVSGVNITRPSANGKPGEMNVLDKELQKMLRKKKYTVRFPLKDAVDVENNEKPEITKTAVLLISITKH